MTVYRVGLGQDQSTVAGALSVVSPGDTIEVCADAPGHAKVYTEDLVIADADIIIRGRAGDNITIKGAASHAIDVGTSGVRVESLVLESIVGKYALRMRGTGGHCESVKVTGAGHGLYNTADNTYSKLIIEGVLGFYAAWLRLGGGAQFDLLRCFGNAGSILTDGCGDVVINHALLEGFTDDVFINNSGAVGQSVTVNNSIIMSNQTDLGTNYLVKNNADSPFVLNNCLIQPRPTLSNGSALLYGGTYAEEVVENKCVHGSPLFKSPRFNGQISLVIDDYAGVAQWNELAQSLGTMGINCCLALSNTDTVTSEDWENLSARVAEGHEIIGHARDSSDLTIYSSSTDPALVAQVAGCKSDIETNIPGYTCKCFAAPQGLYNDAVRQAVVDAGFIAARKQGAESTSDLTDFKPFYAENLMEAHVGKGEIGGFSARDRAAGLGDFINQMGRSYVLVSHPASYGGDAYTNEDWIEAVRGLLDSGVRIKTMAECVEYITSVGEASGSGRDITYNVDLVDAFDPHIANAGSPCVFAGVSTDVLYDLADCPFEVYPTIGLYAYSGLARNLKVTPIGISNVTLRPVRLRGEPCKR